jgi:hypothetical protein
MVQDLLSLGPANQPASRETLAMLPISISPPTRPLGPNSPLQLLVLPALGLYAASANTLRHSRPRAFCIASLLSSETHRRDTAGDTRLLVGPGPSVNGPDLGVSRFFCFFKPLFATHPTLRPVLGPAKIR